MAMKIVVVVDVQNDFVYGALGSAEAQATMKNIIDRLMQVRPADFVIFTRDTHNENYFDTQEGKNLPVLHCVYNTEGWRLADNIDDIVLAEQVAYINKPIFGSYELIEDMKSYLKAFNVTEIELFGFCTDICVISNALMIKSAFPELKVQVNAECCAGVTPAKHEAALEVMRSCQIEII